MTDLSKYAGMRICVAVSGGRDSMALLHYVYAHASEYGITLSALNCDHAIRGEASARDSEFVREWCAAHKIPLLFFKWDWTCNKTESSARLWRLKCYVAAASASAGYVGVEASAVYTEDGLWNGVDAIATAHHLNDNAETVLFNLARGSGLSGMEGITDGKFPVDGGWLKLIRPFAGVSREEIDAYVRQNDIPYTDDLTNFADDYTRNKIRHSVLPELEKAVPGAAKAIYRFSRLAADDEQYFSGIIKERGLINRTRLGCEIAHCKEKVIFKRAVISALTTYDIKDYTSEHAQRLYELQFAEKGKKFEFLGFTAFKEEGKIAICDNRTLKIDKEGIPFKEHFGCGFSFWNDTFIHVSDGVELEENLLAFEAAACDDERVPKKLKVLKFDCDKLPETAVIRAARAGDKFTKFGGGTKSLGDYFTDIKIPVRIRKRIPLIADGSRILAVGGVEISDSVKVEKDTRTVLYLLCEDFTTYR